MPRRASGAADRRIERPRRTLWQITQINGQDADHQAMRIARCQRHVLIKNQGVGLRTGKGNSQ